MVSKYSSSCNMRVLIIVALFAVNTVSSMRCYTCSTETDPYCASSPKKYENCSTSTLSNTDKNIEFPEILKSLYSSSHLQPKDSAGNNNDAYASEYNCGKFLVEYEEKHETVRMCTQKVLSCQDFIDQLAAEEKYIKSCDRCDTDLCNSSSHLSIKAASVILFVVMSFMTAT